LVGAAGDVVAGVEYGPEHAVLAVRGFNALDGRELWQGDERVRAWVARHPGRARVRESLGTLPGELEPMVTEGESLNTATGALERREVPEFVVRMAAENKRSDPSVDREGPTVRFYEVGGMILAAFAEVEKPGRIECYTREGTRRWQVTVPEGPHWPYATPRNFLPVFDDGVGHVVTLTRGGPMVIDLLTGAHEGG
jgi:hypothetical protein